MWEFGDHVVNGLESRVPDCQNQGRHVSAVSHSRWPLLQLRTRVCRTVKVTLDLPRTFFSDN